MDVYETHVMKDSLLPFIFHLRRQSHTQLREPNNWHENVEIFCFLSGSGTLRYDGEEIPVCEGDVAVINANALHTTYTQKELRFAVLILDRAFCLANGIDTNALEFQRLIRDETLRAHFDSLIREYRSPNNPYRIPMIRAEALLLLSLLCREYSKPNTENAADSRTLSCIRHAVGILRSEYASALSLEEVAERVGLSKYYFAREFRRITGYTLISYLHLIRCQEAKRLLSQTEQSIAEISHACGFENASYFSRIFRTVVGKTPGEYRK